MAVGNRKDKAVQTRLADMSRSQIAEALGLGGGGQPLGRRLHGVPAPGLDPPSPGQGRSPRDRCGDAQGGPLLTRDPGRDRRIQEHAVALASRRAPDRGVAPERPIFRLHIHESVDASEAVAFWSGVVGAQTSQFGNCTIKTHNPETVRKNVGSDYHGCLLVYVSNSGDLNLQIDGWCEGFAAAAEALDAG